MRRPSLSRRILTLLLLLAAGAPAHAQERTRFELTDEDVEPLRTVLPARAALARWLLANGRHFRREMDAVATFAYVPPDARFDGLCTHARLTREAGGAMLIFTMPSPRSDSQLLDGAFGSKATAEMSSPADLAGQMQALGRIMGGVQAEANARTKPIRVWYRSHGFREVEEGNGESWLARDARDGFRVTVSISSMNPHSSDPYCMHLDGPMIEVWRESDTDVTGDREKALRRRLSALPVEREPGTPVARSEAEEAYAVALGEAGLTENAFEDLLTLIFGTRSFLATVPDDQAGTRSRLSELGRERLDANVAWIRKHGDTILPLVDALHEAYGTAPATERRAP